VQSSEEELANFATAAEKWLAENVPSRWSEKRGALGEDETTRIKMEWDRTLYRGGYAGLSIPVEFGGRGLGVAEEVVFGELAARAHAPDGFGRIGRILTAPTLVAIGSAHQQARYLPPILRGEEVWCQGFSEPGAGSDLASVITTARSTGEGYLVSGQKIWTSFAAHSDKCLLLVRSDPGAPRYRNLTMLLMDMKQPGVNLKPIRQISGTSHFAEMFLDDAYVSSDDRLGAEGDGWNVAMTVLSNERGGVEGISRYVEIRGDLDILQSCCATQAVAREMAAGFDTRLELVRWQVLKALSRIDDPPLYASAVSVLKLMWSELWQEIATVGLESMCPTHEEHWRFSYLETRSATIYAGSSEIQRNIIGDRVLGLPR
jgi:alkylation response protein AidB-like acyl-CoA dehydrogenase